MQSIMVNQHGSVYPIELDIGGVFKKVRLSHLESLIEVNERTELKAKHITWSIKNRCNSTDIKPSPPFQIARRNALQL